MIILLCSCFAVPALAVGPDVSSGAGAVPVVPSIGGSMPSQSLPQVLDRPVVNPERSSFVQPGVVSGKAAGGWNAVLPRGGQTVTKEKGFTIQGPNVRFVRKWGTEGKGNNQFNGPFGIAVNPNNGRVYVADTYNHWIMVFNGNGKFVRKWGTQGAGNYRFKYPSGIAVNPKNGLVYVVDKWNDRIMVFNGNGKFVRKWGGTQGKGNYQFNNPYGIAVNPKNGLVYVADTCNERIMVFSGNGKFVQKWGTKGTGNYQFDNPDGIAVNPNNGLVYVADTNNDRISVFRSTVTTSSLSDTGIETWE